MTKHLAHHSKRRVLWALRLLLIFSFVLVPLTMFPHTASAATSATDDFNRADGGLGPNWTAISDGGMSISSQVVAGATGGTTGDVRTAESYPSDQYSKVEVTSTQLTGGQWVGPAVRVQGGGQNGYLGIYFWNSGNPVLRLYKRSGGSFTQLGGGYVSGALAAGTQLEVTAVGNKISFLQNGVQRVSVTDGSFTGGGPGIMAFGSARADNWAGGPAAAYSVGGTVSGLSGTVVLQDNGGDDLSVSGNGGFTFATPVADGAGYNVTVKTNPAGQSCTVSAATGTVSGANVTSVTVSCAANSATSATDDFNRADGGLGPNWTAISDGGMSISSQVVAGATGGTTGDVRTAESYPSDQYSKVEVTSTQLTGGQWVGPAVRVQGGGQNGYLGIYFWNSGNPVLRLYKRSGGSFTQLGGGYVSGALAAGTQLEVTAVGNKISFLQNGVQRVSVTDGSFTGGGPGIMAFGSARADNWAGGPAAAYSVGGTVSGLSGTVVLQDNGGDDLSVSGNGGFTFATPVADGAGYNVTVKTNPAGQSCTVSAATGTVSGANVTSVTVSCAANSATSATDDFNRADGGLGPNWTAISDGGMSISSQVVAGATGGTTGDVRTAESYPSDQYSKVEVTSTQLTGGQWVGPAVRVQGGGQNGYLGIYFWNSGNPVLRLYKRSGGSFTQLGGGYVSGALAAGTQLEVTAVGNKISFLQNGVQRVSVTDGSFTGGGPGIMAFGSARADNWAGGPAAAYSVGGTVSGLSGTVVLQDNGGDDLSVSGNGGFTFATPVADGAGYNVTVKTNPAGESCTVSAATGTVSGANVTSVTVSCHTAAAYSVGGTVSGLSGTVVLQDNGGDDLSVSGNGGFTFATPVADGAGYNVTVKTNPAGQSCTVSAATGTVSGANVTSVTVSCAANSATSATDDFNRADGGLGPNWTAISDGGMSISSQVVAGATGGTTGDVRTAESYPSDQYSKVEVTSTQLTGGQWVGPAVRVQGGGQNGYLGIYFWNFGSPEMVLFERNAGNWTQLGSYNSGALAAGTQLEVVAVGNTIAFLEDGVQRVSVTDGSFTGGGPGIMAFGSADADNWSGGNAGFQANYQSTDPNGIKSYNVISSNDGYGSQTLRVLAPTNPAAGVAHNFLIALPVEAGLGNAYGDGIATLQALDAQNKYNLTIIEPSFAIDPWYADNPVDLHLQYETFMTQELVPWIKQHLATTGNEQIWLIGFSKSGLGGEDLILKHPDLFTLAASWDFPADMSSYDQYAAAANYGTDANFQANYRLTTAFMDAHKGPFVSNDRIWIGGYSAFQTDVSDYDVLLTSEGIAHNAETPQNTAHRWDSGWVPIALAALYQDSINLH